MENIKIEHLRKVFTISNAAFDFQDTIMATIGLRPNTTAMRMAHKRALMELEKPEPNMVFIEGLLLQMEELTKKYK